MQVRRHPAGLLIIGQYLQCSFALMGQLYLSRDKALLPLWQGGKAISSARTNSVSVFVSVCTCMCVRHGHELTCPMPSWHMFKTDIGYLGRVHGCADSELQSSFVSKGEPEKTASNFCLSMTLFTCHTISMLFFIRARILVCV